MKQSDQLIELTDADPSPTIDDMTTALQVAEKAIQLADQNPHFIYEPPGSGAIRDCLYVHEDKGSCIFGRALLDLGVADAAYLDLHKDERIGGLVVRLQADGHLEGHADAALRARMTGTQIAQDDGNPWADAVASLREFVGALAA